MLWRLRFALGNGEVFCFKAFSLGVVYRFSVVLVLTGVEPFPAQLDRDFVLAAERFAVNIEDYCGFVVLVFLAKNCEETSYHHVKDSLFLFGKLDFFGFVDVLCRENSVMVADLCVVDYARINVQPGEYQLIGGCFIEETHFLHQSLQFGSHIIGYVVAVRSRIGKQLLFIERLHYRERCRCRKSQLVVGFSL